MVYTWNEYIVLYANHLNFHLPKWQWAGVWIRHTFFPVLLRGMHVHHISIAPWYLNTQLNKINSYIRNHIQHPLDVLSLWLHWIAMGSILLTWINLGPDMDNYIITRSMMYGMKLFTQSPNHCTANVCGRIDNFFSHSLTNVIIYRYKIRRK